MIGLVDADTLLYYAAHQDSTYEGMKTYMDSKIEDILSASGVDDYMMFLTSRCFRYDIPSYKKYKGTRKKAVKKPEFYALEEYMIQRHKAIRVPELEADDLVLLFQNNLKEETRILSTDKDVLQQAKESFNYNPKEMKIISLDDEQINYNVYHQMLTGDSTDNIEGVHGVGPAGARKILKDCESIPETTLNAFMKKYGQQEGMFRYLSTYRLVYMLKTKRDLKRETNQEIDFNYYLKNNLNLRSIPEEESDERIW